MPGPSTGLKLFRARPNFLGQTKKLIYILYQSQTFYINKLFLFSKFGFCYGTKVFEEALLNTITFLDWPKTFWDL
jgi:hypothetical protein